MVIIDYAGVPGLHSFQHIPSGLVVGGPCSLCCQSQQPCRHNWGRIGWYSIPEWLLTLSPTCMYAALVEVVNTCSYKQHVCIRLLEHSVREWGRPGGESKHWLFLQHCISEHCVCKIHSLCLLCSFVGLLRDLLTCMSRYGLPMEGLFTPFSAGIYWWWSVTYMLLLP